MAKISPASVKYDIIADFASEGPVEKPDVIGALFGQTEGLLGEDLELRELQKEGKIGRIEVNLTTEDGKTKGEIIIPSALDKTETTIVAAALETIDKIGPTDAKITIEEIKDVRGSKRDYIMERAKKLLGDIKGGGIDSTEMGNQLRESARTSKICEYGEERLSAGPDIESSNEVIVVEGRADVLNLLKQGIKNVIGMMGTRFPKEITKLGEKKELTLFVDGDRGGNLIAKNVCDNAKIKYVAVAPDGKEVEELTGKEILQALRKKLSPSSFLFQSKNKTETSKEEKEPPREIKEKKELTKEDREKIIELSKEIKGRDILILNSDLEIIKESPASKLSYLKIDNAFVLIAENTTRTLVEAAEKIGISYIAAKKFGNVKSDVVEFISV